MIPLEDRSIGRNSFARQCLTIRSRNRSRSKKRWDKDRCSKDDDQQYLRRWYSSGFIKTISGDQLFSSAKAIKYRFDVFGRNLSPPGRVTITRFMHQFIGDQANEDICSNSILRRRPRLKCSQ